MTITQSNLDRFWIFLVQMNAQASPFVPSGSQWNHATSQWENSHNSAISWPILDLFGTNEHLRIPFGAMLFSIESRNLSVGKFHISAISWLVLDPFGRNEHKRIPLGPMWFSMESHKLSGRKWQELSHFLTDFKSFWYKWTRNDFLLSHVVRNGITKPLKGKMP